MDQLTIGEIAVRSGIAHSALRFYEGRGLISSSRTAGNQRRYARVTLRRLAFIQAGRRLDLSLEEIGTALAALPEGRTPNARDWAEVSHRWVRQVDARIAELQRMRDTLDGCIGCGCLSLRKCGLFNHGDKAATQGAGARWLLGDDSDDVPDR